MGLSVACLFCALAQCVSPRSALHNLDRCGFVVSFEIEKRVSTLFSFFHIVLAILSCSYLHTNFRITLKSLLRERETALRILVESADQCEGCSHPGRPTVRLHIREHRTAFHFFRSLQTSFSDVLWFSLYKAYTSLLNFIPKYSP